MDVKTFVPYGFRIADLEGGRRLAPLAAQMRGQNVDLEEITGKLGRAGLRDPYDGSAFSWNSKESSYVFRRTLSGKPDLKLAYRRCLIDCMPLAVIPPFDGQDGLYLISFIIVAINIKSEGARERGVKTSECLQYLCAY